MHFANYRRTAASEVTRELQSILQAWSEKFNHKTNNQLQDILQLLQQSVAGGKMLRGTLLRLGYTLINQTENPEINKIAAAYEILHTALLIDDDVFDQSKLRRGMPTVYHVLGTNQYAISQSICLASLGLQLTNNLIAQSNFPPTNIIKTLTALSATLADTFAGEMLDIKLSLPDQPRREEDIILIHTLKTARYSVVGPLLLGAMLAGADETRVMAIKQFGDAIGIAFQIQDDILGIFGDEQTLGKSTTSDIAENKNTILIAYALSHASEEQKKILAAYYGKSPVSMFAQQQIKKIFIDTGSLRYSQTKAEAYVHKGRNVVVRLTTNPKLQKLLNEFSDFSIERMN